MKRATLVAILLTILFVGPVARAAGPSTIKVGHVINITVLGHAELSRAVVVREDGTTDYPLLANIPIDGMSVSELSTLLAPILTRYVERPLFFVNISEYRMLNVRVVGQVMSPGPKVVQEPMGLQGVLAVAGGPTEMADLRKITIIRRDETGRSRNIQVNLLDYFRDEVTSDIIQIMNGDMIVVPMLTNESYVRVVGSVRLPGKYVPMENESVLDLIYKAGGEESGDMNDVLYITRSEGRYKFTDLKLKKMVEKGRIDDIPIVKPGDIIVIRTLPFWKDVHEMAQFARDLSMLVSAALIFSRL